MFVKWLNNKKSLYVLCQWSNSNLKRVDRYVESGNARESESRAVGRSENLVVVVGGAFSNVVDIICPPSRLRYLGLTVLFVFN